MNQDHDIILFDGVCNLCNGAINFIIARDPKNRYKFAALESEVGQKLLATHEINPDEIDSIVLIRNNNAYVKAGAAIRIAQYMSGGWPIFYAFRIIPGFLSNVIYDFIAKNRYRWFGKKDSCMIPTPELKSKFL
jgi:predicted DCC family thiol-disulfide oxidoreductase YuxK